MAKKGNTDQSIMGIEYKWEVLLLYLLFGGLLGFIFSFMKDKKVSKKIKFQYNQSGTMFIVLFVLGAVSRASNFLIDFGIISGLCYMLDVVVVVFAIITIVKAFSDEEYEMPIISDLSKMIWK
ncbi:MAG: hypothetical protein J6O62_01125 [Bacilli bacterium]|nr:hypothetical protein [Bacilli bacterium]